jgi:hypothetical protein
LNEKQAPRGRETAVGDENRELGDDELAHVSGGTGTEVVGALLDETAPRDASSGLPTGKRMHMPFVIVKTTDKSSP